MSLVKFIELTLLFATIGASVQLSLTSVPEFTRITRLYASSSNFVFAICSDIYSQVLCMESPANFTALTKSIKVATFAVVPSMDGFRFDGGIADPYMGNILNTI